MRPSINVRAAGLTKLSLMVLQLTNLVTGTNRTQGCNLVIPEAVRLNIEPEGEPLLIQIYLEIIDLREVTDNGDGGSFGVDIV